MRVDRSKSGEYASPKRIRITHHAWRACGVALSIFNDFGEHAPLGVWILPRSLHVIEGQRAAIRILQSSFLICAPFW